MSVWGVAQGDAIGTHYAYKKSSFGNMALPPYMPVPHGLAKERDNVPCGSEDRWYRGRSSMCSGGDVLSSENDGQVSQDDSERNDIDGGPY